MPSTTIAPTLEDRLRTTGALLQGHFQLSSGLHSPHYIQCARLLQHPGHAAWACARLAERITGTIDVVVGPALGGVIVAYELARALGVRALFTERVDGVMQLRRGFAVGADERILVAEDVVTTGKSAREAVAALHTAGGRVVGLASLVDRSGGTVEYGVPFVSLLPLEVTAYAPARCPLCAAGQPVNQPGSRPPAATE
ncbi:MAG: orotate phosphoribosyltransferase [Candidatus Sericytochromatia bacterium]|nr:orotate phosphoribosyltransferase [Candidatus Sericytochromatia bacterium]